MASTAELSGLVIVLPSWTPYAAVGVSGLAGATYAAKRGFDVVGVFGIAFATGLGGLLLRDLLITTGTPNILTQPAYVVVAFWTAVIGFFFAGLISRFESIMVLPRRPGDGVSLHVGGWCGTARRTRTKFGGVCWRHDGHRRATPARRTCRNCTDHRSTRVFVAVPAIVATALFVAMIEVDANPGAAQVSAMVVSLLMRAGAQYFGWQTGSASDLSEKVWSFWSRKQREVPELTVQQTQQYFLDNNPQAESGQPNEHPTLVLPAFLDTLAIIVGALTGAMHATRKGSTYSASSSSRLRPELVAASFATSCSTMASPLCYSTRSTSCSPVSERLWGSSSQKALHASTRCTRHSTLS